MTKLTNRLLVCAIVAFVPLASVAQASKDATNAATAQPAESAKPIVLAENAPTSYTVVSGDTLWGIAAKFLRDPWRWPDVWNLNRDQVKDPHWIYPGNVIRLITDASGQPRLALASGSSSPAAPVSGGTESVQPRVRIQSVRDYIPSISAKTITPFLTLPLVASSDDEMLNSPKIVSTEEERVIVGTGDIAYVVGLSEGQPTRWQIYRPGKALVDPITSSVLGYEALYLGDARVLKFGDPTTTIDIVRSNREINRGDRLAPTTDGVVPAYVPHAPASRIVGSVVSLVGGVGESPQYSVVVLSLGKRDGIEVGHVLAAYQAGNVVSTNTDGFRWRSLIPRWIWKDRNELDIPSSVRLPNERNGLVFVFRVFDKVSYALVMSSSRALRVGDVVQTP